MGKPFLKYLIALTLICVLPAGYASDDRRWYEIEIIVFSNNDNEALNSENWPVDPGNPLLKSFVDLKSPEQPAAMDTATQDDIGTSTDAVAPADKSKAATSANPNLQNAALTPETPPEASDGSFVRLKEDELGLTDQALKIATSDNYHLLLHTGWRQPVEKNKPADYVYLDQSYSSYQNQAEDSGDGSQSLPEDKLLNALINSDKTHPDLPDTTNNVEAQTGDQQTEAMIPEGPIENLVYGLVGLKMTRFLHLTVDLVYRAPYQAAENVQESPVSSILPDLFPMMSKDTNPEQATQEEATQPVKNNPMDIVGFRLKESRRIHTNELIFYDHPLFGVIARVKPYDPPVEEQ